MSAAEVIELDEARRKARARSRSWYEANKAKALALSRDWSAKNPEKRRAAGRAYRTSHPEKRLLSCAKQRARLKGLPFELTEQDIFIPEYCPVFGIKLDRHRTGKHSDDSPSLDRLDPSKGYVRGNVIVMSYRANMIKNCGSSEEHRRIAAWMSSLGAP
jgi:hypothetical protein